MNRLSAVFIISGMFVLMLWPGVAMSVQWQEIVLQQNGDGMLFAASSVLESARGTQYGPENLFDDNPSTCWCEGNPDNGAGESLFVEIPKGHPAFFFRNGYAKRPDLFEKNNRVKTLTATLLRSESPVDTGSAPHCRLRVKPVAGPVSLALADQMAVQRVVLPFDWQAVVAGDAKQRTRNSEATATSSSRYILQLAIAATYPGSRYNDTCLSDLWLTEKTVRIYVNDTEDSVLIDTNIRKGITLVKDETALFRLLDQTQNKEWLIAYKAPKTPRFDMNANGRETEMLFHVGLRRQVDLDALLDGDSIQLLGFDDKKLSFGRLPYNKVSTIDLDVLEQKLLNAVE